MKNLPGLCARTVCYLRKSKARGFCLELSEERIVVLWRFWWRDVMKRASAELGWDAFCRS